MLWKSYRPSPALMRRTKKKDRSQCQGNNVYLQGQHIIAHHRPLLATWSGAKTQTGIWKERRKNLESKVDYAVENSPTTHGIPSTCVISYVGKIEWGGLAPFIESVYTFAFGHVMLEINATEKNFCISFQTVHQHERYVNAFRKILDEEGLSYTIGEFENRKLPEIILPPDTAQSWDHTTQGSLHFLSQPRILLHKTKSQR